VLFRVQSLDLDHRVISFFFTFFSPNLSLSFFSPLCFFPLLFVLLLFRHLVMPCVGLSCCPIALPRHVVSSCYFVVLFPHCLFATSLCCFIVMPLRVALCTIRCFVVLPCVLLRYLFCATLSCCFFTSLRCLVALPHYLALLPSRIALACCHCMLPRLATIARCLKIPFDPPPHLLLQYLVPLYFVTSLPCRLVLPSFFLQGGAWSLEKCVLQQLTIR
jgi:hypothetical protein